MKEYKNYIRRILIIAVPLLLSNIISQVQMIIDRAFLGQVNPLYMSALGNVNSPLWMSISFCFAIVTGASILISQAVGAQRKEDIVQYSAAMLKWNNIIPIILFFGWLFGSRYIFKFMGVSDRLLPMCVEYITYFSPIILVTGLEASASVIMQTSNYTKPLLWFGIIRSGFNVLLDWILIFGKFGFPQMGIKGAAIATTIAEYIGLIYATYVFTTSDKLYTRASVKDTLKAPLMPFLKAARLGINSAFEDFAWNLGNLVIVMILNTIDDMAAGLYSMVFSVELLVVVVVASAGNATMTLSGEAKGKKDIKQFKGVCTVAYGISAFVSVIILIVCALFPDKIMGIFTNDAGIIASCTVYLILMCLNLYGKSANIIVGNGIRGSGDTRWMFIVQVFGTVFVIACAALFVFVFKLGMLGVFIAVMTDEFTRAVINFLKLRRIIKNDFV